MNEIRLLDLAMELGYRLAMAGAETFRIEESIRRVLGSYGITAEVFSIPNCLHVTITTADGTPVTKMRRIGIHGNDLDAVEHYSNLSRRICALQPDPETFERWLQEARAAVKHFPFPLVIFGSFTAAAGFCILFGGSWVDFWAAGFCGILVGLGGKVLTHQLGTNPFFRTMLCAFVMAFAAYGLGLLFPRLNTDAIIIGASMLLVPGLLFTNAMRDIIFGDTNSGLNRIVQVILIAAAIAVGTGAAHKLTLVWGDRPPMTDIAHAYWIQAVACFIGCTGFSLIFTIHGQGSLLCTLGGVITWLIYLVTMGKTGSDLTGYFFATLFSAVYSELMARIRKYPAISYLVVSIFPLLPGAGLYITMTYAVNSQLEAFAAQGLHTGAIAGVMAVAILLGSSAITAISRWRGRRHLEKARKMQ